MAVRHYIIPYDPAIWRDPDENLDSTSLSSLRIKVFDFIEKIRQNWPGVALFPEFSWEMAHPNNQGISGSFFGHNNQILALEVGEYFNEFVLWYRSYIPSDYPLYLFREGEWESLRLTPETTLKDIKQFTGL